jgi:hypothetical protein
VFFAVLVIGLMRFDRDGLNGLRQALWPYVQRLVVPVPAETTGPEGSTAIVQDLTR